MASSPRRLAGDEGAYARLVAKYREPLQRHVRKMVRDTAIVEDLVQEAFVKAFRALPRYAPEYAFSTWLYRIATNHTIDHIRRKKLRTISIDKPLQTRDGEMQMELPGHDVPPGQAPRGRPAQRAHRARPSRSCPRSTTA